MTIKRSSVTGISISELVAGWSALGLKTYAEAAGLEPAALREHLARLVWRKSGAALEAHLERLEPERIEQDIADRLTRASERMAATADVKALAEAFLSVPRPPSPFGAKRDALRDEAIALTRSVGVDMPAIYARAFEGVQMEKRPMSFPTGRQR